VNLLVLLSSGDALAEPGTEISLPVFVGFGNGFVIGARPEILHATNTSGSGFELGAYGLAASDDGHLLAGAGLTALHYHASGFAYGPSVGYTTRGLEVGLFVGARFPEEHLLDGPGGLRIDAHFGPDGSKELVVALQLDVLGWLALGGLGSMHMARD
jgi:hypothetical protein